MNYFLVGLGGIFGSILRFCIGRYITGKSTSKFPWGTFLVNITGAFLLGLISFSPVNNEFQLFFGEGFLGAFTTFSTFMYEGFNLFENNKRLNAMIYILASMLVGISGFISGAEIAKLCF